MCPKVSVIIPCFNGERFVAVAINSVLNQTYKNVEVIIVDDGSTDRSRHIVESFGANVRYFYQSNSGGCAARNYGIKQASGEFIKFLDCDDRLLGDALDQEIGLALKAGSNSLIISNSDYFYGSNRWAHWRGEVGLSASRSFDRFVFLLNSMPLIGGPLYRRDKLNEIGGFDESLTNRQDVDLFFRYLLISGAKYYLSTGRVGYLYRDHTGSRVSKSGLRKHHQSQINMLKKHAQLCGEVFDLRSSQEILTSVAQRSWSYGRQFVRTGDPVLGNEYFSLARSLGVPKYVAGGRLYKGLSLFLGPVFAERISCFSNGFRRYFYSLVK